jgi:hypothetical protein
MVPPPMGRTRGISLAALLATAVVAGCGGGNDSGSSTGADLANPVGLNCDPAGFQHKPPARHFAQNDPSGWSITYRANFADVAAHPGVTTNMVLIEESPQLPANGVRGGHPVTVKGQQVSLKTNPVPPQSHVAQWKTAKARYIAISNGARPTKLEELIACLP